MGQLTNLYVSESYQGLIKLTDSTTGVTGTLQYLQDGLGNRLPMQMSTSSISITGSLFGTASYATQALSASWAPDNTDTGSYVTTSSFNAFTSSIDGRVDALEIETGSLQNQINQKLDTGSFNSYTASMDARTGSYATTGSNNFIGDQNIATGSFLQTDGITNAGPGENIEIAPRSGADVIVNLQNTTNKFIVKSQPGGAIVDITGSLHSTDIVGTGSLFLQPNQTDVRYLEIYNTSPTDTHITASGGQIFLGDDQTYVKVDNYGSVERIDVVAGNELNVSSSIVNLTGSLHQSGTFYPDVIDWINSSIVQSTGSYILTTNISGVTEYDSYQNIASALQQYINTGSIPSGTVSGSAQIVELGFATTSSVNEKLDTGSFNSYTASMDARTGSYATTGSNVFKGLQTISGSLIVTGSITALSASITYLETVYQTSSVLFSSGSNILGDEAGDTQTLNGVVNIPLGNLNVTGATTSSLGFFGNLQGTASYATNALSASEATHAVSASYAPDNSNRNGLINTGSIGGTQSITGSLIISGSETITGPLYVNDVAATFQVVGNGFGQAYLQNPAGAIVLNPGYGGVEVVGANAHLKVNGYTEVTDYLKVGNGASITGSVGISGSLNVTNGITGSLQGTASYATQALSASEASHTVSSSYANNATSASYSNNSTSASFAQTSISSSQADNAVSASEATHAVSSSYSNNSTSSSYSNNSTSSSYANNATSASFSQNTISGSFSNFAVSSSHSVNSDTSISSSYAQTASFASNGGVTQLLAGPNITISPLSGKGQVTISSTGTGTGSFNTATGSYGSFYDTTNQINPVANTPNSMSFNETAITNGVAISGSISPFNTYIKTENAGVYNLQFSAQVDKTDSGTDSVDIWIRKNGSDLLDTATTVTLTGNNDKSVAAWNWFVQSAANDYYQIIWASADTDMRLLAEVSSSVHPGIPSVIATANRIDQFLSNTGSFNGDFNGSFTGSLQGTASFASNALSSSYSNNSTSASFAQNALSASYAPTVLPSGLVSGSSQISYTGITDVPSGIISGSVQVSNLGFATTSSLSSYVLTSQTSSMSVATASYVLQAVSASFASNALSASYAPGVSIPAGTVSGSAQIVELGFAQTSSLSSYVLVSQTGSMSVATASYVLQAVSASYATNALTASFALNAVSTDTGSLMKTGSVAGNILTFTKGDGSTFNLTVATGSGGGSAFPYTGSAIISGSLTVTGSINVSNGTNSGSVITNQTDDKTLPRVNNIVTLTSAEYNTMATASTLDANTLYVVSGSAAVSPFPYSGSIVVTGSIQGNVNALSISSNTASLDLNNGNFFTLQLVSGSNTFINPSNIKPGQTINVLLSTTGSGTVTFPSSVKQISGSSYTPTTTTSKDIITLISFDSSSLFLANVKNLI